MAVLAQFLLAFMGSDFLLFSFATAGHSELLTKDGNATIGSFGMKSQ